MLLLLVSVAFVDLLSHSSHLSLLLVAVVVATATAVAVAIVVAAVAVLVPITLLPSLSSPLFNAVANVGAVYFAIAYAAAMFCSL